MAEGRNLESLREDYSKANLNESDVHDNPFVQFERWFTEAQNADLAEPNAMALATVDLGGKPTCRVVLLKSFDQLGFVFYTNYTSDKGFHMEANPNVAATFLWKELQRQVRIEGVVKKMSKELSEKYFQSRPRSSQIGAWVSNQSEIILSRETLEDQKIAIEEKFEGLEVLPVPEFWGGYYIVPQSIEFWQGRRSRLHDRLKYVKNEDKWELVRLSP